jgi:hypothetical protein
VEEEESFEEPGTSREVRKTELSPSHETKTLDVIPRVTQELNPSHEAKIPEVFSADIKELSPSREAETPTVVPKVGQGLS